MKGFIRIAALLLCAMLFMAAACTGAEKPISTPEPTEVHTAAPAEVPTEVPTEAPSAKPIDPQKVDITDHTHEHINGDDYGVVAECKVWFEPTMLTAVQVKEIAGYRFVFSSSFVIRVDADGEVYELNEAFEKGLLGKDDVAEIYRIHKANVIDNYNGASLYDEFDP